MKGCVILSFDNGFVILSFNLIASSYLTKSILSLFYGKNLPGRIQHFLFNFSTVWRPVYEKGLGSSDALLTICIDRVFIIIQTIP